MRKKRHDVLYCITAGCVGNKKGLVLLPKRTLHSLHAKAHTFISRVLHDDAWPAAYKSVPQRLNVLGLGAEKVPSRFYKRGSATRGSVLLQYPLRAPFVADPLSEP